MQILQGKGEDRHEGSLPTLDHLEEPASLLGLVNAAARTGSFSAWKDSHWGSGSLASRKRVK